MSLETLFEQYTRTAGSQLNLEQFQTLLTFFPALQVVAADGEVDEEEWVYVRYIARAMAENYAEDFEDEHTAEELKGLFLNDLEFLSQNLPNWKEPFISALADYLAENPEVKQDVHSTMHMFSDASEGSEEGEKAEEKVIREMTKRLGLED